MRYIIFCRFSCSTIGSNGIFRFRFTNLVFNVLESTVRLLQVVNRFWTWIEINCCLLLNFSVSQPMTFNESWLNEICSPTRLHFTKKLISAAIVITLERDFWCFTKITNMVVSANMGDAWSGCKGVGQSSIRKSLPSPQPSRKHKFVEISFRKKNYSALFWERFCLNQMIFFFQ